MFEALVLSVVLALAVGYGGYKAVVWAKANARFAGIGASGMAAMMVLALAPANTFAQSTIEFDLAPFFDSLNTYLPIFIGLFAIVGGIAGAMALARYVIGAVVRAFSGGTI